MVTDVFTREVATKALPDKAGGDKGGGGDHPKLVQDESNYVVTTDMGNEFGGLEGALPGGVNIGMRTVLQFLTL